jgi:hypothetical protein
MSGSRADIDVGPDHDVGRLAHAQCVGISTRNVPPDVVSDALAKRAAKDWPMNGRLAPSVGLITMTRLLDRDYVVQS